MPRFLVSKKGITYPGGKFVPRKPKASKVLVVKETKKKRRASIAGTGVRLWAKTPFAPLLNVEMVYSETIQLTSGALGVFDEEIYRANDLFDPDFAIGGHQPYGRDTLATLYNKYKVLAVKVDLTFTDPKVDGMAVALMTTSPNELGTGLANHPVSVISEKPNATVKFLNNSGTQIAKISRYYPMWRLAQITPLQFEANIGTYSALTSATPAQTPFIRVGAADVNDTAGSECKCLVKLTFYTQWYDRKILLRS